ncbi:Phosphoribulokinase, partial [hydrothermal vent metagenome]
MSQKHPVVAVTGSSGAGTSTVKKAFEHIFRRENISPVIVEGDSFHAFDRAAMKVEMAKHEDKGNRFFSHFGENANEFGKLAELFESYSKSGTGQKRYYLHSEPEAVEHNARLGVDKKPGEFTPWEDIETGSDLMFYEGLHGLVKTENNNVAQH